MFSLQFVVWWVDLNDFCPVNWPDTCHQIHKKKICKVAYVAKQTKFLYYKVLVYYNKAIEAILILFVFMFMNIKTETL